jgi:hypothetical protein
MTKEESRASQTAIRRLAPALIDAIARSPGHKGGFYRDVLMASLLFAIDGKGWPTPDHLLTRALQQLRREGSLVFKEGGWYRSEIPVCPHCHRVWPEAMKVKR